MTASPLSVIPCLTRGLYTPGVSVSAFNPARGLMETHSAQAVVAEGVAAPGSALVAPSLTPESPALGKGDTRFLDAVGLSADASIWKMTRRATWTVADPAFASVAGAGTLTALAPGTTRLTARLGAFTIATPVTISPPQLGRITVAPAARTILGGETVAYTAAGHFSDGTAQDLTAQVTWSTGDAAIAAVAAGSTARGTGVGSTPVSATWGPSPARRLSR